MSDTFSSLAQEWLKEERAAVSESIKKFAGFLLDGDAEGVSRILNEDLLNNPSYFDFISENSYHMFIYGMLLAASSDYTVHSNRESGKGRADCLIKPMDKNAAAAVVEFKHMKDEPRNLKEEAQKGLEQIDAMTYIHNLRDEGYSRILKYGIAFHKKTCEVVIATQHNVIDPPT